ncbi:hypothetical protein KUTeg_017963 [Tegillarca granosa]|uniref:Non-lysosomal glucosylceramidase n=1 Tax=Tegillarca granosa TaxID=220873 RepID=A0ABQ9ELT6_TEGGR|nr:hypothetical protein KUTeg_017963 [Tegillarca granosa]
MAQPPHGPDQSITTPREKIPGVPDYGWRVNEVRTVYKTKAESNSFPDRAELQIHEGMDSQQETRQKDVHRPHVSGCPIGGIGCGTIGRGFNGEFCRFQIVPGIYDYNIVQANQFVLCIRKNGKTVYQKVLTGKKGKKLKSWQWGFPQEQATYHALYPRAWTVYNIPEHNLKLTCRQVSPIFPHDYKDTSFPMAAFIWTAENNGSEPLDISIMFTFKNGRGVKEDLTGGTWNEPFESEEDGQAVSGVLIHQKIREMKCTYGIAGAVKDGVDVTHKVQFDPKGTGADVWDDLCSTGRLSSPSGKYKDDMSNFAILSIFLQALLNLLGIAVNLITLPFSQGKEAEKGKSLETAAAVCIQTTVPPAEKKDMEFALTWDMPVIHFKSKGKQYARRYARWFGTAGDSCPKMCSYALHNYPVWERKIEEWQNPILENKNLPAWYKSALFNELYYVSDGGTIWLDPLEDKDKEAPLVQEYSKFAYLEGQEYRMYNTYDVHHNASFALAMLWPKLQLSIQYDIAKAVTTEDSSPVLFCMEGVRGISKFKNAVPHDIGDPEDDPWLKLNAYIIHPTNEWRDLNLKFVVVEHALKWDTDDDGIIDNGGFADQTFDAWKMTGASAYCGGMWLAVLRIMVEITKHLNESDETKRFSDILEKATANYEKKLWNGQYYDFDSNPNNGHHDSVMSSQLDGHWFLKASGLEDNSIFPKDHVISALKRIYKNNVMGFGNGNMGAINGTRPNGDKDISSVQSEEFWVGVSYGLAATMIQEGMLEEGFQTAWGAYHTCWEWYGLHFQTPEAYMTDNIYRSLGYMRPLSIWSLQYALEKFHPHLFKQ